MVELPAPGRVDVQHLHRLLALGRRHLLPVQAGVGHGAQVAGEVARGGPRLAAHEGRGQLGHHRDVAQPLDGVGLRGEHLLAADAHPLDQPQHERVRAPVLERRARRPVQAQEVLGAVAALGRQLRPLERGADRRRHVELAPPGQLGQPGDVHRVQPHRGPRHHAHGGAGVGRVGQQPQPGQQVAHLGALEVGGRAVQAEGQRPLLERRAHHGAVAHGRGHQHRHPRRVGAGAHQRGRLGRHRLRLGALGRAAPEAHAAAVAGRHPAAAARRRAGGGDHGPRAAKAAVQVHGGGVGERAQELVLVLARRRARPQRLLGVGGHGDLAGLLAQQRQQGRLGEVGVLVVVGQHRGQAAGHAAAHVRALVQQPERAQHQVAGVQRAAVGQQPVVVGVQLGELTLAQRGGARGVVLVLARGQAVVRVGGQLGRGDHVLLQPVDPRDERGQQRSRVAADLVVAQRQLLQLLQQQRHPLRGRHRHEARIQAGLHRLGAQQARAEGAERVHGQLVVGRCHQLVQARAHVLRGLRRGGQRQHLLGVGPLLDQPGQPVLEHRGPARAGDAGDQQRPTGMGDRCPLGIGQSVGQGGHRFQDMPAKPKAGPACCRSGPWPILCHPPR